MKVSRDEYPVAIVFDFDGVLVESVDVKTQAFAKIYEPYGQEVVARVVAWHSAQGGVSRFDKFHYFHNNFLGRQLSDQDAAKLGESFSRLVEDAVVASKWVLGARELLDAVHQKMPLYVASGTPESELKRIISRRGMDHYFVGIFGSPAKKSDILQKIVTIGAYPPGRVMMIGDSLTDYEGAVQAAVRFVGRVPLGQPNPFPDGTAIIPDLLQFSLAE